MKSQVDFNSVLAPSPTGYLSVLIFLSLAFLINKTVIINRTCRIFTRIKYNIGETFVSWLGTREFLLFFSYNYHSTTTLGSIIQTQLPVLSLLAVCTLKSCSSDQKGTLMMVPVCTQFNWNSLCTFNHSFMNGLLLYEIVKIIFYMQAWE